MARDLPCLSIEDTVISLRRYMDTYMSARPDHDTVTSPWPAPVGDRRPGHLGDGGYQKPRHIREELTDGEAPDQWRD